MLRVITRRMPLTPALVQALLSMAGFGPARQALPPAAFVAFVDRVRRVFRVLHLIRVIWDCQLPSIVAGLEVSRAVVEARLQDEAATTFVCRVSLATPGTFVISCRVRINCCAGAALCVGARGQVCCGL